MKLFGFGEVSSIYNFIKVKIFEKKKQEDEEFLFFENEISSPYTPKAGGTPAETFAAAAQPAGGKVVYIKWPLRAEMFSAVSPPEEVEALPAWDRRPVSGWGEGAVCVPVEEADVLTLTGVVKAPILKPVAQGEASAGEDLFETHGAFFGLFPIDLSGIVPSEDKDTGDGGTDGRPRPVPEASGKGAAREEDAGVEDEAPWAAPDQPPAAFLATETAAAHADVREDPAPAVPPAVKKEGYFSLLRSAAKKKRNPAPQ